MILIFIISIFTLSGVQCRVFRTTESVLSDDFLLSSASLDNISERNVVIFNLPITNDNLVRGFKRRRPNPTGNDWNLPKLLSNNVNNKESAQTILFVTTKTQRNKRSHALCHFKICNIGIGKKTSSKHLTRFR